MNERQYHQELIDRLERIERLIMYIKATIDSPDYNISLTIPKPVDCIGKCENITPAQPAQPNPLSESIIPWE